MVFAFIAGAAFWRFGYMPLQQADVSAVVSPSAPELLIGSWTSSDDASYKVTFSGDGSLTERYGDEDISSGTYRFAASPEGYVSDKTDIVSGGDTQYLLQEIDGERYAYRVMTVLPGLLELSYLDRGNTLTFTR